MIYTQSTSEKGALKMTKEKLLQLQFALFFKSMENRPDKLINKVDEALEDLFDQMPNMLPLPPDAPAEIPRVTMQSTDEMYVCNISKNRIDFIGHYINSGSSVTANLDDFITKIFSLSEAIFNGKAVNRFGFVEHYFIENRDAVGMLKSKYFKYDFGDLEELNLRYNKPFTAGNLEINDVIEISKGNVSNTNGAQKEGIIILRDMNNKPTDNLTLEDMKNVIEGNKSKFISSGMRGLIE